MLCRSWYHTALFRTTGFTALTLPQYPNEAKNAARYHYPTAVMKTFQPPCADRANSQKTVMTIQIEHFALEKFTSIEDILLVILSHTLLGLSLTLMS